MKRVSLLFYLVVLILFLNDYGARGFDSLVDLIPSRLEGKTRGESVHVADLKFGTPRKTLRAGLDFAGDKVYTIDPQTDEISSTYTPMGGGSDLIWISGHKLRLPVETNPFRVETLCDRCEGLIGVSPSSPLWVVWKEATFGSGAVSLGDMADIIQDADTFNRLEEPSQLDNHIQCDFGFTDGLCRTMARVGPNADLVHVVFSFDQRKTLLPGPIYDAYTDGKNIKTSDPEDWDDLDIEFVDLTLESEDTSVSTRIRRHDLVSLAVDNEYQLNVGVSPEPTTVYIGRTAFRSFFVHMRWIPNTIQVVNWRVEKSYQGYTGFVLLAVGLVLVWWKGTRTGMWAIHWRQRAGRILGVFFYSSMAIVTIWVGSTRSAIREFLLVDVFFQSSIYTLVALSFASILLHLLMRYGYGKNTAWFYNIFGLTYAEETFVIEHEYAQQLEKHDERKQRGNRNFTETKGTKSRIRKDHRLLNVMSLTSTGVGTGLKEMIFRRPRSAESLPWSTSLWYNADVGSQRIWAIITFCGDMILLYTLIYAWISTREDTLAGIGTLLLFSFIIVIAAYHIICHFYHRSGHHAPAWYAFLVLSVIHLVLLILVAEVYVYYPFIHRFIPDYSNTPSIISFLFTLGLFYFAENIAKNRVSKRGILYQRKIKNI